jgi:Skp family chaperone for outer membrane proteins
MKKVFFSMLLLAALFVTGTTAKAQSSPIKIGVFDIEMMVRAMPGAARVDTLIQLYERDSLQAEYQFYYKEFQRLDSTFKADSASGKPKTVLDLVMQQRQQVGMNIAYWQQIAQQKSEQKRAVLSQSMYEQVVNAYKKVLDTRKYTLVLKPGSYEVGLSSIENVFQYVAKELKVKLPDELGGDLQDDRPATGATGGAAKPATGAKPK